MEQYWERYQKFYFKCLTCGIRTSKPRNNYVVKHIESDYPREKYKVDTTYLANYISNDSNIKLWWLIISQSLDGQF